MKRGQRIKQGTVIGRVGQTGLATGPHLHYQMWRRGKYVDPMKIDLPNQAPLPSSELASFKATVGQWVPVLDEATHGETPAE